jgi:hypothetical protein
MADIQVANTDADLSGNTVVTEENAYTITGLHTFSRSTNAPFACISGAAVVTYLDADKLDGQEGTYYLAAGNITGTLAVNQGGTGAATFTDGGVLLGSGTSAITATAVLGDGVILIGDASGDPTTLDVGSSTAITILGTIATGVWNGTAVTVTYGGTGASSLTDGGVLLGSGTGAITAMSVLADSEMIVGNGSTDPVAESGATLRTSIGVGTGDSPTFTAVTVGQVDITAEGDLRLQDNTGGEYVGLDAPSAVSGSYTLTFPAAIGAVDQVLSINNTDGTLQWATPDSGDITSVVAGAGMTGGGTAGDVTLNVIGTADKITVNANDVTIASTYVGQTSITTLGTVATGVWNGTAVTVPYGGTGATSLTDGGVLLGSGTGAVTAMSVLADSEMIVGDGSTDPVAESGSTLRTSIGCDSASNITSGTLANARLPSNVDLGGTLDVTGATTLDSTVTVAGASTLNNSLLVDYNAVIPVTLKRDSGSNGHGVGVEYKLGDSASASAGHSYGQVIVGIADNTDGGEDGNFYINLSDDGSMTEMLRVIGASGGVAIGNSVDPGAKALHVVGALSKGSGSFKIDHPLPALTDSKYLVHSFIEGPKADLIYRGTVTLVDGTAEVDLDEAAGMSSGTWILLCRDEQVFSTNETGWFHVRGSVTGSTLTIDCEESTCTDTVSWMVVACRQDDHMKNSDTIWTDEDGYPIVEPDKPAPSIDPEP